MIKFSLTCANDHAFESWFQSSAAFDTLCAKSLVNCGTCGSTEITKSLMAPAVRPARGQQGASERALTGAISDRETELEKLRKHVEMNSDYVGMNFAAEARAMHEGDAPSRSIYGEAKVDDARSLIEDGVPVAPLPFRPTRQTN